MFASSLFSVKWFNNLYSSLENSLFLEEKAPFGLVKWDFFQTLLMGSSYHALFTLDHKAFVPVHSTNATDDIIVLVVGPSCMVLVAMVTFQRIWAVGLADRLADDLIDLDGSFVSSAVVSFPQPAYISAYRWLPAVIFLAEKQESLKVFGVVLYDTCYTFPVSICFVIRCTSF